jgi:sulfite reductase (NADPH) flavoprotein alpha-component
MDATSSYRIVGHHLDPEVEAMLSMYEIGVMRRLDFGARFAIAVGENGLEHLPLDRLYRRWVRCLYALAEISNAHRMDVSVRDEPLSRADDEGTLRHTAYRLQFGIESHARFLAQTVPMVCRRFAALWRTTSGPCSARESSWALVEKLEQVLASRAAVAALADAQALERALESDGAAAGLRERLAIVTAADAGYLGAATMLVASGVKAFETYERDVLVHGAEDLLAAVRAFPVLTRDHFEAVAG